MPPVVLGVGHRGGVWYVAHRDVGGEVLVVDRGVELVGVGVVQVYVAGVGAAREQCDATGAIG